MHTGSENSIIGLGWGVGVWGDSTWGTPRSATNFLNMARIWSFGRWGEDLVMAPRDGGIYVWDSSNGVTVRATLIAQAPETVKAIYVSPEDRHMIALGAYDGVSDNPMYVRWCDQENYTVWDQDNLTVTSGGKQLDDGNELYCAVRGRNENLVFSDTALYAMRFVGPPDTFGFEMLGDNGGLASPMAVGVFQGVVS